MSLIWLQLITVTRDEGGYDSQTFFISGTICLRSLILNTRYSSSRTLYGRLMWTLITMNPSTYDFKCLLSNKFRPSQSNVTRSRKRGHFPQNSDCKLDISADSTKKCRENYLMLACRIPKVQSFEFHTCAYLDFKIRICIYFSPVAKRLESLYTTRSTMFGWLLLVTGPLPIATVVHLLIFIDV